eukprot:m.144381 g.144381  ORF g.144381 m.144381 type:complete len:106 (+) comp38401_c0_seq75:4433-4750(+)
MAKSRRLIVRKYVRHQPRCHATSRVTRRTLNQPTAVLSQELAQATHTSQGEDGVDDLGQPFSNYLWIDEFTTQPAARRRSSGMRVSFKDGSFILLPESGDYDNTD